MSDGASYGRIRVSTGRKGVDGMDMPIVKEQCGAVPSDGTGPFTSATSSFELPATRGHPVDKWDFVDDDS